MPDFFFKFKTISNLQKSSKCIKDSISFLEPLEVSYRHFAPQLHTPYHTSAYLLYVRTSSCLVTAQL
jgi:hypothetical protein